MRGRACWRSSPSPVSILATMAFGVVSAGAAMVSGRAGRPGEVDEGNGRFSAKLSSDAPAHRGKRHDQPRADHDRRLHGDLQLSSPSRGGATATFRIAKHHLAQSRPLQAEERARKRGLAVLYARRAMEDPRYRLVLREADGTERTSDFVSRTGQQYTVGDMLPIEGEGEWRVVAKDEAAATAHACREQMPYG